MTRYAQTDTVSGIEPINVSVKQAAQIIGVTPWTIYKRLDEQKIESHYEGRRRLVDLKSLRAYAKNLPIYPPGPAS